MPDSQRAVGSYRQARQVVRGEVAVARVVSGELTRFRVEQLQSAAESGNGDDAVAELCQSPHVVMGDGRVLLSVNGPLAVAQMSKAALVSTEPQAAVVVDERCHDHVAAQSALCHGDVADILLEVIPFDAAVVGTEPYCAVVVLRHRTDVAQGHESEEAVLGGAHRHAHAVEADPQRTEVVDIETLQRVVGQRAGVRRDVEHMVDDVSGCVVHEQSVVVCCQQSVSFLIHHDVVDRFVVDESPDVCAALIVIGFAFSPCPTVALFVADGAIVLVGHGVVVGDIAVRPSDLAIVAVDPRHGTVGIDQAESSLLGMDGVDVVELSCAHLHGCGAVMLEVVVVEPVWADRQNPEVVLPVGVHHQQMSADLVLMQPSVRVSVDLFCLGIEAAVSSRRVGP